MKNSVTKRFEGSLRALLCTVLLLSIQSLSIAQTTHFVQGNSMRNYQLGHYYNMMSWNDSQYKEFTYWMENSSGGVIEFMNWRVVFPPGYQQSGATKYPMIVMLHGAGESGREWTGKFSYQPSDPRYDNNDHQLLWGGQEHLAAVNSSPPDPRAFPGIVIFPQLSYNGAWSGAWDNGALTPNVRMVTLIIEYMIDNYNADQYRIATHGLSNGARGVWDLAAKRPDLIAAASPMSGVGSDISAMTDVLVTTPLWLFQGGQDTNPSPGYANSWINELENKGGNPRYTLYPDLGHGVWNTAYAEPDFFSWMLAQHKKNIYVFGASTAFCPGSAGVKLGFSEGFTEYQWMLNGLPIAGATTRFHTATQPGTYTVQFRRQTDGVVDLSFPTEITQSATAETPLLTNTGSVHLPIQSFGSINNVVNLIAPTGYPQYGWYKNGILNSTTSTNIKFIASNTGNNSALAGDYTVQVMHPSGCWSPASNAITVTYNNPQPTTPAFNILSRTPQSSTEMQIIWEDVAGETGYEIWRYRKGDYVESESPSGYPYMPFSVIAILPANTTSYLDVGVRPSANYIYRVRAVVSNGAVVCNAPSPTFAVMPNDFNPPTTPANLAASDVSYTEVTLLWSPSTDNDVVFEYEVYNGSTKLATIRSDTTDADRTDGNPAPPATYTVTGLTPGTTYNFSVRANDYRGQNAESNHSAFADVSVTTLFNPNGLSYKYYEFSGSLSGLSSFNFNQTPKSTGAVNNFSISIPRRSNQFVIAFDGYIQIDNSGTYRFYTRSDDGSRLYINGASVVNNDGQHSTETKSGTYNFPSAGLYPIRVTYFDQNGSETLTVKYNQGTLNSYFLASTIPDNKLFRFDGQGQQASSPALLSLAAGETTTSLSGRVNKSSPSTRSISVYPVPFENQINISFPQKNGMQPVALFDLITGKMVRHAFANSDDKDVSIDFADVAGGRYILIVGNKRFNVIKKN